MKPVAFDYTRPASVAEAVRILAMEPNAKVLAGGQTLGPMLNLRLVRPTLLIDIARISELMVAGSSLVVSDHDLGDETGQGTDFIVVTH